MADGPTQQAACSDSGAAAKVDFPPTPPACMVHSSASQFSPASAATRVNDTGARLIGTVSEPLAHNLVSSGAALSSPLYSPLGISNTTTVERATEADGGLPDVMRVTASRDEYSVQSPGQSNFGPHMLSIPRLAKGAMCADSSAVESNRRRKLSMKGKVDSREFLDLPEMIPSTNRATSSAAGHTSSTNSPNSHSKSFAQSSSNSTCVGAFFSTLPGSQFTFNGRHYGLDTIRRLVLGLNLLSLCSGLPRDGDVADCCRQLGMNFTGYDTEVDPVKFDLVDQTVFDTVRRQVNDRVFDAVLMAPPCSTFSSARSGGRGPSALRGEFAPDIYGFKSNRPHQKELCRVGTILALRCDTISNDCLQHSCPIPHLSETPGLKPGRPSVAKLPEIMQTRESSKVDRIAIV